MPQILAPLAVQRFVDNNGNALVSGQLFTYQAGSTTPAPTYTDSTGGTQNSNPVVLNARGECQVWLPPNVAYKFTLQDSLNNTIWTVDQIVNSQLTTLYGGVDTGAANAYLLNFAAPFTSYADGAIVYWIPANTNTGPSTININGLGVIALVNQDGSALRAGEVTPNLVMTILIKGGQALLISGSVANSVLAIAGTAAAPSISFIGDPSSGFYLPATGLVGLTLGGSAAGVFSTGLAAFTLTGVNATVNFNARYYTNGLAVILEFPQISGTSNSTSFGATTTTGAIIPQPNSIQWFQMAAMRDNGAGVYSQVATVQATGSPVTGAQFTFYKGGSSTGWTNSGTKGIADGSSSVNLITAAYMLI